MPKFIAVKLIPKGPFRDIPRADTLFGAIGNATSAIHGQSAVEELVDAFMGGARISSAFPYSGDTYYLPKPLSVEPALEGILTGLDEEERYTTARRLRKAKYLDLKNFELALRLRPFTIPEEIPYARVDVPRVVLDRVTQDSSIYFWGEIRFREKSGVYFPYSGPREVFDEYIAPAMRFLGDTGIGGKSTWGAGLFEVEFHEMKIDAPGSEYSVTLSNALPTKTPVLWRLLRKGGWSFGRRKPRMTFIAEGSIVKNDPGRMERLELGLSHEVYVYGLTFPLGVELPEGLE